MEKNISNDTFRWGPTNNILTPKGVSHQGPSINEVIKFFGLFDPSLHNHFFSAKRQQPFSKKFFKTLSQLYLNFIKFISRCFYKLTLSKFYQDFCKR